VEKNEILPKKLEVNVWSQDRTYDPKYHSGRTTPSSDVRSRV
jgi:hypothetical protein